MRRHLFTCLALELSNGLTTEKGVCILQQSVTKQNATVCTNVILSCQFWGLFSSQKASCQFWGLFSSQKATYLEKCYFLRQQHGICKARTIWTFWRYRCQSNIWCLDLHMCIYVCICTLCCAIPLTKGAGSWQTVLVIIARRSAWPLLQVHIQWSFKDNAYELPQTSFSSGSLVRQSGRHIQLDSGRSMHNSPENELNWGQCGCSFSAKQLLHQENAVEVLCSGPWRVKPRVLPLLQFKISACPLDPQLVREEEDLLQCVISLTTLRPFPLSPWACFATFLHSVLQQWAVSL